MERCECCGTRHNPMKTDCPDEDDFDGYYDHNADVIKCTGGAAFCQDDRFND